MSEASERQVEVYVSQDGRCPFNAWLTRLKDRQARAKIRVRLNRLRLGNLGDCKPIGEGVTELRIDYGPGYRVYFGQEGPQFILLLCGGDKHTQRADIQKAHEYWINFKRG